MKEAKLKELEERLLRVRYSEQFHGTFTINAEELNDLITAYRQLEKDNERLQKALDKADPRGIYDDNKTAGGS